MLANEVAGQQGNVFLAVTQGRQLHGNHIQPVIEILTEAALLDLLTDILIGRRQDADVNRLTPGAAHRCYDTFLDNPEDLDLGRQAHVRDLVKKEGAAVGCPEKTIGVGHRPGKGALFMPEEFALQEGLGKGAAVDRDKDPILPGGPVVKSPGDELLPGAALALDQHGAVSWRHPVDQVHHSQDAAVVADQLVFAQGGLSLPLRGIFSSGNLTHRPVDHIPDNVHLERLPDVVIGAKAHGLNGVVRG